MDNLYFNFNEEKLSSTDLIKKIKSYDVELTRKDVLDVIGTLQDNNHPDTAAMITTVNDTYHINMAL